jgi:hypothetical protein
VSTSKDVKPDALLHHDEDVPMYVVKQAINVHTQDTTGVATLAGPHVLMYGLHCVKCNLALGSKYEHIVGEVSRPDVTLECCVTPAS